jgi:glycosyltransferase involved in cell wall biosynthesis
MKEINITIAICTYNRASYVRKCLLSIRDQVYTYPDVEVLVVDNNSQDETKAMVSSLQDENWTLRYVMESNQGLSYARNRAIKESEATWIAYLDDDATGYPDYVQRMKWVIDTKAYDCFGGMYYAHYEQRKPKWIGDDFGTKRRLTKEISQIDTGFLSGGNFICKKEALEAVGGFDVNLGMNGTKMGYGEEDKVQMDLRAQGYILGFDPELKIDHLVAAYKLKPWWHIKRKFHSHRDMVDSNAARYDFAFTAKRLLGITFKEIPALIGKFFIQKDFYRQNLYIQAMSKYAKCFGLYLNKNK